jgi:SepF-like predicted cell division protein (DUF552 family)
MTSKVIKEPIIAKYKQKTSAQHELSIKTVSIHNYSQLEQLKESLLHKEPIILIARITPLLTQNPEEGIKLVNELCLAATKNNYSVFRLGEERIMVVPSNVQIEDFASQQNQNAPISDNTQS